MTIYGKPESENNHIQATYDLTLVYPEMFRRILKSIISDDLLISISSKESKFLLTYFIFLDKEVGNKYMKNLF